MGITEFLSQYITAFIGHTGYVSVFVLMMMESMVFPVPSEAVMPFAGFLIAEARFNFPLVIIVSTFGSIAGSLLSYWIGAAGGKPFVNKFGKYLLLNKEDLAATERFFDKRGELTILICRFIPVIRHLISLPAGMARMNLWRFSLYTIIGAGLWNTFLTLCGFHLRKNWDTVMRYSHVIDIVVIVLLAAGVVYFIVKHLKRRSSKA
jgi:membrane protein DedA with SNARE-associated domain